MVLEKCPEKTETLGKDSCSKEEQKKARKRKKKSQPCRKYRHLPPAQQKISESLNQRKTLGGQTFRTKTVYRFEYDSSHVKEGRTCTKPGIPAYLREIQRELSRLAGQIRRLYGSNKKVDRPFWICLTGFMTDSPLYEECLRMNDGFSSYLLDITEEDCFSLFPLETLVYLTPDSEHALQDVDLNKVYILGGLVDESIQKKVTFQKAQEYSVKTARLPIQEYMVRLQNGKNYHSEILAINQVFDILSTFLETHNWPEALKKGVSLGKGYVLRNSVE
ncbi:tRNA methyltransferase 10 homolog B isoform X4 [Ictidomys tridecemlineatus]